jgi:hypothetical protein
MAGFFVHAGTADQSASPPLSPSGPISHDFQFERTIEWSQAGAGVVATIAMVANTGSFKGPLLLTHGRPVTGVSTDVCQIAAGSKSASISHF